MLEEFYAVTKTSVYHVKAKGKWAASATKIALKGRSAAPVGKDIAEGGMIAVCSSLQAYIPEKYGSAHPMTGFERRLEHVKTCYWGWSSSPIVALFKNKDAALTCLDGKDQKPCDPRWLDSTKQVLAEIGEEHPSFYISRDPGLALIRPQKVA